MAMSPSNHLLGIGLSNAIAFLCLGLSTFASGQELGFQTLEQLKASPAGSTIIQLTNHINHRDSTVESDLTQIFADDLIKRNGVEKLISIFAEIRKNDGQWEIYDANRVQRFKYELKAKGLRHGEWLEIGLRFDPEPPHKISAIDGVSFASVGPKSDTPLVSPSNVKSYKRKTANVTTSALGKLNSWLESQTKSGKFSGVVLLAKDYKPVYHKAFGLASKRYNVPNQLDTRFRLASVNKIFTATAILQLIEQGKLSLDDKLVKHIDGFTDPMTKDITIRHLLTHSSGWGAYWNHPEYLANKHKLRTVNAYLSFIKTTKLDFAPGSKTQYSNTGYNVLGAIIEKVTGKSYYDFLQENVFEPANMTSTSSPAVDEIAPKLATGYTNRVFGNPNAGNNFQSENIFLSSVKGTPAGGGVSCSTDLLNFLKAIAKNKY